MKSYKIKHGGHDLIVQLEDATAQAFGLTPWQEPAPKARPARKQAKAPANKAIFPEGDK